MIKRLFSSQLRINMVSGTVTTAINVAVMIVAYPLYLHFLGYENYGVWLVLTTVLTFAQLGDIGISPAIMKLVAEDYGRSDIKGVESYVATALAMLCGSGLGISLVVFLFKNTIVSLFNLSGENADTALWLLPYVTVLSVYVFFVNAFNAVLSGLGRMDLANYVQSFGKALGVLVAGVLLYMGRGIESLLIASSISYIFIHAVSYISIRRIAHFRLLFTDNLDFQRAKRILRFGGAVFGASALNMLFNPFNKLILSRYAGISTLPVYEIAYTGSMQVRALIETGLKTLMPEISRINGKKTKIAADRINEIYRRSIKLIFCLALPLYILLVLLSPWLLKLWIRNRFSDALPDVFRILLIGTFFSLCCVPAYYTLMGLGRVRYCFLSNVVQGVGNAAIVGTLVLCTGSASLQLVAWAVTIAMGVTSLYLIRQNRRVMKDII